MAKWLPFDLPWDTVQTVTNDMMHWASMFILAIILGGVAIVIILKVRSKWAIPLFIAFMAPCALILGGYIK
jgi:hypothetical protein